MAKKLCKVLDNQFIEIVNAVLVCAMDALAPYSIPVRGLKNGPHDFHFEIDDSFFRNFEESPIGEARFTVDLAFDKRPNLYELEFHIEGVVRTECDRCLAPIWLPVNDDQILLVKITEELHEEEAEVIYLSHDAPSLNVAQYIYEYCCLALPINKVYECETENPRPCDMDMLKHLSTEMPETDEPDSGSDLWDALKKNITD